MDELPAFRANKRRRVLQQKDHKRALDDNVDVVPSAGDATETAEEEVNVAELIRIRKLNKRKAAGIKYQNQKRSSDDEGVSDSMALTKIDPDEERLRDISNRFIGSTGQVVDVDKHMMAYIDSEMAKRQNIVPQDQATQQHQLQSDQLAPTKQSSYHKASDFPTQAQLSEFDLGLDAQQKNLARTTAAIARAHSGLPPATPTEPIKTRPPRKPRLGRDGKPFRPRPRKRRNSTDIARDALVEQILHEHRMDVYEGDGNGTGSGWEEDDSDADERLAEQFKQEFMDAMTERQAKNQIKAATAARAKGIGPEQSGPKLGGSRSARAKMAAMQQQQQLPGPGPVQKGGGAQK